MKNITFYFGSFLQEYPLGGLFGREDEKEMDERKERVYSLLIKIHYCEYWGKSDGSVVVEWRRLLGE